MKWNYRFLAYANGRVKVDMDFDPPTDDLHSQQLDEMFEEIVSAWTRFVAKRNDVEATP